MATKNNKTKASPNKSKLRVDTIIHEEATRKNIPTAEYQSIMQNADKTPIQVAYERRNKDLDPQLVWRGKDQQDWTDLVVSAPPLYIQEKVHPKVIIDDLINRKSKGKDPEQIDLFSDFNGLPNEGAKTEFYRHDAHWTNRMILGDSLQVMASLAEREGLRGKVQSIYIDPPYGIKFNSNFQWSTTSTDVQDGKASHITREPEQVKAFRDTWRDGIHSYLTYLRDRFELARDLLTDSGSIFVQIGEENVHRVRALLDEVFGDSNCVAQISFRKKLMPLGAKTLESMGDYILWYARDYERVKYRQLYVPTEPDPSGRWTGVMEDSCFLRRLVAEERSDFKNIKSCDRLFGTVSQWAPSYSESGVYPFSFQGKTYVPTLGKCWVTSEEKMRRLDKSQRLFVEGAFPRFVSFHDDFKFRKMTHPWRDTAPAQSKQYVVETNPGVIQRCILMTTDPGDLVLDPTCGSGTTAYVAEQWGRRWITIDTSRVALALARSRIMGARYPYYILSDSKAGQLKEAEITRTQPKFLPVNGSIRPGFVYERVPHITLKSIANNDEIDTIWEKYREKLEPALGKLNSALKRSWKEWELPKEVDDGWPASAKKLHSTLIDGIKARQLEMDNSIIAKAESELLYDRPFVDKSRVRVAGPFTIESVSPHRILSISEEDYQAQENTKLPSELLGARNLVTTILETLKTAGVQQAHKEDKIVFSEVNPWPGKMICAEATYTESKKVKRAAILIGPEFGTVSRVDLVEAAKEAAESDFEVVIACAFNFDARATDFSSLGKIPVLKARMNADLHMAEDLKNTGKGNLFVIFGEPDIEVKETKGQYRVKINGVDIFHPNTGEVRSDGADGIACWMIDTDYNEESFFVRHAYFLGANDPYKALKSSLKNEIEESAWESLNSDVSRPFDKPESGRIAVKVINHLGDEVMKVFKV